MKVLRRIIALTEQPTVTSWKLTWTNLSCRPHPLSRSRNLGNRCRGEVHFRQRKSAFSDKHLSTKVHSPCVRYSILCLTWLNNTGAPLRTKYLRARAASTVALFGFPVLLFSQTDEI